MTVLGSYRLWLVFKHKIRICITQLTFKHNLNFKQKDHLSETICGKQDDREIQEVC